MQSPVKATSGRNGKTYRFGITRPTQDQIWYEFPGVLAAVAAPATAGLLSAALAAMKICRHRANMLLIA